MKQQIYASCSRSFSAARTALLVMATLAAASSAQAGEVLIDLGRGPVTVHIPDVYDGNEPAPLVMLLHGYGASGAVQEAYFQLLTQAEDFGFLFLAPDGTLDPTGSRFWNATDACCQFFGAPVDDSGYLRSLIEEVRNQLLVDSRRIYIVGHSNGGFMAHRMACEHADTVAAIASLAGATWFDPNQCSPSEPVDALQIHGTADATILFDGGNILGNVYPSALGTAERWATENSCSLVPDTSAGNINLVANIPGMETTITRWEDGCQLGGSAELWTIPGGVHTPNLSNPFPRRVIEYLFAHPKPGLGATYCFSTPNSTGLAARIQAQGSVSIAANDLTLIAQNLPVGSNGLFYYGPEPLALPFGAGLRCVGPGDVGIFRLPIGSADMNGQLSYGPDWTNPPGPAGQVLPGASWKFQAWFRDPAAGGSAFDLTDALSLTFEP